MAGFLYYVPGGDAGITLDRVEEVGLGHALSKGLGKRGVAKGPDGKAGVVIADPGVKRIGYHPDDQTWAQIDCSDNWIGYYTEDPPKPVDFARKKQLGGHWVTLGDDEKWLILVARGLTEEDGDLRYYVALPEVLGRDGEEWATKGVAPKYARLWGIATTCAEGELSGQTAMCEAAAEVLSVNYQRLGPIEIEALGLFTTGTVGEILAALIDIPTQVEIESKKKREASELNSTSDAGLPDSTPATDPPSAT